MNELRRNICAGLGVLALSGMAVSFVADTAAAADSGKTINWRAVANTRNSNQWAKKWMWLQKELPELTNGQLTLNDLSSFPELGLTGQELIRVLRANLVDMAEVVTGYVSGEVPLIEGVQLPGVYKNYEQAKKAYLAWTPAVVEPREKTLGGYPIASFAFGWMYMFSKFPVDTLEDLKGKKIRVFAKSQSDFLEALGAEPVNIPLADIYTAMERGTVDGVITGSESAVGLGLPEVAGYVTDLRLGVGAGFVVISRKSWDRLSPDVRKVVQGLQDKMNDLGWQIGYDDTEHFMQEAIKRGVKPTIPAKPEWNDALDKVAREAVVPAWAKRAGPDGIKEFNRVVGPIVGFTIPQG